MINKIFSVLLVLSLTSQSIAQSLNFSSSLEKQAYLDAEYDITVNDKQLTIDESYTKRKIQLQQAGNTSETIDQYRIYYFQFYTEFSRVREMDKSPQISRLDVSENNEKNVPVIVISSVVGLVIGFLLVAVLINAAEQAIAGDN